MVCLCGGYVEGTTQYVWSTQHEETVSELVDSNPMVFRALTISQPLKYVVIVILGDNQEP